MTMNSTGREISIDGTLAADSDALLSTQKAIKTYVDSVVASAGAWNWVSTTTISGTPANIDYTDLTYPMYAFAFFGVLPTGDASLYARTSTDNGTSFTSASSSYRGAAYGNDTGAGLTVMYLGEVGENIDTSGVSGLSGVYYLCNPTNASVYTQFTGIMSYDSSVAGWTAGGVGAARLAAEDNDAIRFLLSGSQTFASGVIVQWGISAS